MNNLKQVLKIGAILSVLIPFLVFPERVAAADNNPINPAAINTIFPLNGGCGGKIQFSVDMQNMPSDWVDAVVRAGWSWANAGSKMTITDNASQAVFSPVDYNGNPIEADGKAMTLKKCEVRVFRASSLGGKYIVSLEDSLASIPVNDSRTQSLAG
jgi:hypothetical protein